MKFNSFDVYLLFKYSSSFVFEYSTAPIYHAAIYCTCLQIPCAVPFSQKLTLYFNRVNSCTFLPCTWPGGGGQVLSCRHRDDQVAFPKIWTHHPFTCRIVSQKWLKNGQNFQKLSNIIKNFQKFSKVFKSFQEWPRGEDPLKTAQKWQKNT